MNLLLEGTSLQARVSLDISTREIYVPPKYHTFWSAWAWMQSIELGSCMVAWLSAISGEKTSCLFTPASLTLDLLWIYGSGTNSWIWLPWTLQGNPQTVRDKIYELVAFETPCRYPGYWVNGKGQRQAPNMVKVSWSVSRRLRLIRSKTQNYPSEKLLGSTQVSDFCHFQGFAQHLDLRAQKGNETSGVVFEGFLNFMGVGLTS
jgi:hypothetical protein